MAARLNPRQDERSRAAIQTTQLCKRLNAFALGQDDPCYPGQKLEMSDGQIRAAVALLRKTMPDLAVTQLEGSGGGALVVDFRWADASPVINATPVVDAVSHETTDAATDVDTPEITFQSDET